MPRKKLIRSNVFPYHVNARCNNRERYPLDLEQVWIIFESELFALSLVYEIEVHAFVLMPNHFHLIVTIPLEDLGKIMNLLMSNVTRRINRRAMRSGHIFGGPYFWSIIMSSRYYGHVLKYVYRNPVRAKISETVLAYPFSTVRGLFGLRHLGFPIVFTRAGLELNIPDPNLNHAWLDWLETPFSIEAEKLIKKAMKRKETTTLIDPI
jgi:putative transposase